MTVSSSYWICFRMLLWLCCGEQFRAAEDLLRVLLSLEVLPLQCCRLAKAITTSFSVSQLTSLSPAPEQQIFEGTGVEEGRRQGALGFGF